MSGSNIAASVRQRLLNRAKERGEDFQLLLTRYANERLLYRLSQSAYRDDFVLKGATMFSVWSDNPHRATRDVDLLGFGQITKQYLKEVFSALASANFEDGLLVDAKSIQVNQIRQEDIHGGLRVSIQSKLGTARISLQIDVGLGDAHATVEIEVPSLLAHQPAARMVGYAKETVFAEKIEAAVKLAAQNSRMKDFYDLATLGVQYSFQGETLRAALANTFARRNTDFPSQPLRLLLRALAEEPSTPAQWKAFQRRAAPENSWSLDETFSLVVAFAEEPLQAAARSTAFNKSWSPGGPWSEEGAAQA